MIKRHSILRRVAGDGPGYRPRRWRRSRIRRRPDREVVALQHDRNETGVGTGLVRLTPAPERGPAAAIGTRSPFGPLTQPSPATTHRSWRVAASCRPTTPPGGRWKQAARTPPSGLVSGTCTKWLPYFEMGRPTAASNRYSSMTLPSRRDRRAGLGAEATGGQPSRPRWRTMPKLRPRATGRGATRDPADCLAPSCADTF